jgi:hypothetical protein
VGIADSVVHVLPVRYRMSLHTKIQLLELLYRKALRVSSAVKSAMGEFYSSTTSPQSIPYTHPLSFMTSTDVGPCV